jgi:hypothetical protein
MRNSVLFRQHTYILRKQIDSAARSILPVGVDVMTTYSLFWAFPSMQYIVFTHIRMGIELEFLAANLSIYTLLSLLYGAC